MPYNPRQQPIRYRINQYITAPTIRLLDEDGKQIGVMPIGEARQQAIDTGLDLVEVASKAVPPVVKLIEFNKFKYQESKKQKAEKKGNKGGELKEIQMTPFISVNDYDTMLKRAQKFLTTGNKVKLSIKFQGRQIQRQEFGRNLVDKFKSDLKDFGVPEGDAKLIGKRLMYTLTPIKKSKTKNENNQ